MKTEDCKAGQVVEVKGKRFIVLFVCKSTYTGADMIRVWPASRPPQEPDDKSGYSGENFKPEDVTLI